MQDHNLVNISSITNTHDYGLGLNMPKEVYYNHWTPTNANAKYPIISWANTYSYSNRFVEDGSYQRLRTIQLACNLSLKKLGVNWMRTAQI